MEQIILILMLFIAINCAFKLSLWRWWQAGIYSLIMAVFTVLAYPYAILQSKTQIADYLQNTEALQNMAVIITLESALCFGFCVTYLRGLYGKKNPWWAKLLWWYPSLCGILLPHRSHLYLRGNRVHHHRLHRGSNRAHCHSCISQSGTIPRPRKRPAAGNPFLGQPLRLHLGTAHYRKRQNSLCRRRRARQLERRNACPFALRYPIHRRLCMEPNQVSAYPAMERTENEKTLLTIHY